MIKKYTKKDGSTAYMFKLYLGLDPITNKQKHTTRRGFSTIKEARTELAKIQTDIANNGIKSSKKHTFKDVYTLWLESYKHTVKESTYNRILTLFATAILPYFENMRINKIDTVYCQKVINRWNEKYTDCKGARIYASQIMRYAVQLNLISINPFTNTTIPKKIDEIDADDSLLYYTADELKQFLEYTKYDDMTHCMFRVLAFTGLRRGELLALEWRDINFKDNTLSVNRTLAQGLGNKTVVQTPKTKSSKRTISVDSETMKVLRDWQQKQRVHLFKLGINANSINQVVFSNLNNNAYLQVGILSRLINKICKKHNFKRIKVHGFRHTHCSLLFEANLPIQAVQDRLGHGDIQTTMGIYAHVTEKQRENTADIFQKYINF